MPSVAIKWKNVAETLLTHDLMFLSGDIRLDHPHMHTQTSQSNHGVTPIFVRNYVCGKYKVCPLN